MILKLLLRSKIFSRRKICFHFSVQCKEKYFAQTLAYPSILRVFLWQISVASFIFIKIQIHYIELKLHFSVDRKKVLQHHPDKKTNKSIKFDVPGLNPHEYFTCITKAYEVLCNVTTRRAFDSVDPTFHEDIPTNVKGDFFNTFRSVFERNSRLYFCLKYLINWLWHYPYFVYNYAPYVSNRHAAYQIIYTFIQLTLFVVEF